MPLYSYKGVDKTGKDVKGNLNTETEIQAKQKIRAMGIMLLELKEQKAGAQKKRTSFSLGNVVSVQDLSLMTRQLSTLIRAKIQIVEAFSALIDQSENPKLKIILSEIKQKVNEGSSLAQALKDYPKVFNSVYCNMVEAGEASGNLEVVLLRLAEFTESQVKLKNKIKGAMIYPTIMVGFGSIMMGVIFTFVIPKITKIFVSMNKELPWTTKLSIAISDTFINYWYAIILGIVLTTVTFFRYIETENGKKRWHRFLINAPIIGELVTMINVSRFCSTLATLLNSGVPILASMKIVKNLIPNVHMAQAIDEARDSISEGASMAGPLIKSGLYPPMVTHMIKLGEKSGEIESMLEIVAENYEDQVNAKLSGLTSVLEPIMMICMGAAVAFIIFSVVTPMMEINSIR